MKNNLNLELYMIKKDGDVRFWLLNMENGNTTKITTLSFKKAIITLLYQDGDIPEYQGWNILNLRNEDLNKILEFYARPLKNSSTLTTIMKKIKKFKKKMKNNIKLNFSGIRKEEVK